MTYAAVGRAAGISHAMVMYIETGQTIPGLETVEKLALAFKVDPRWLAYGNPEPERLTTHFLGTPESDAIQMISDLQTILRTGSGTIDDTYKYLDPLGAAQWCKLLEERAFAALIEAVPLQEASAAIAALVGRQPVDVLGLGAGTARHELGLINRFLARQHSDLRLLLLDVSQSLLSMAARNAMARIPPQRNVPLLCVLGNFHFLSTYSYLFEGQGPRCKVVSMFGYTFANLEDELGFVEKNLSWLPADSLLLLDLPMVFAPAASPSEVAQRDPALSEQRPSEWRHRVEEFLTGPIHRYSGGVLDVTITKALDNRATTVPGSYTINTSASVRFADRPTGHFFMGYTKRYEVTGLAKSLQALGWNFVFHWPYASNTNMLCLFQRAKPAPKRGRTAKAQASLK
ncbi:MAG: L-histidine N(alpha)-methyltransferase [Myxococcales bacterium]|nr:L-histidine N(alpha)-methyltransferase [Myxococcales bacterium]